MTKIGLYWSFICIYLLFNNNERGVVATAESSVKNDSVVTHDYGSNYVLIELFKHLSSNVNLVSATCLSDVKFLKDSIDTHEIWAIKGMYMMIP